MSRETERLRGPRDAGPMRPAPVRREADPQAERRGPRPPIQEASYEEDPAPNGAQIR